MNDNRLLNALLKKGYTKRDIAKSLHYNYDKLDKLFERPDLYVTLHRMQGIAVLLNCSVEDVIRLCLPDNNKDLIKAQLEAVTTVIGNDLRRSKG